MLPMRRGYFVGSLKHDGEEGCLHNNLRLEEAVFSLYSFPFQLDRLPFHCALIFQPHLFI